MNELVKVDYPLERVEVSPEENIISFLAFSDDFGRLYYIFNMPFNRLKLIKKYKKNTDPLKAKKYSIYAKDYNKRLKKLRSLADYAKNNLFFQSINKFEEKYCIEMNSEFAMERRILKNKIEKLKFLIEDNNLSQKVKDRFKEKKQKLKIQFKKIQFKNFFLSTSLYSFTSVMKELNIPYHKYIIRGKISDKNIKFVHSFIEHIKWFTDYVTRLENENAIANFIITKKIDINYKIISLIENYLYSNTVEKNQKIILTSYLDFLKWIFQNIDDKDKRTYEEKVDAYVHHLIKITDNIKDVDDLLLTKIYKPIRQDLIKTDDIMEEEEL